MHNFGMMARRNDIFTTAFLGMINGMLQSRPASICLLILFTNLATALVWDAGVDFYIISRGQRVAAPVVSESWNTETGYSTRYRYAGAGRDNPLQLLDNFFVDTRQPSDVGVALTMGMGNRCRGELGRVTVAYLPENPNIHAVVEDRSAFTLFLIGILCVVISGGLLWNIVRLGRGESALALPGWAESPAV